MADTPLARIRALPLWRGDITATPLGGGRTNLNFLVEDDTGRYVARLGKDIPEHHVMRFNELAASRAAHAAGLSPKVHYSDGEITVIDHIESRTLQESDVARPQYLPRIVELTRRCHHEVGRAFRGPALIFWVFHVIRDYAATLRACASPYSSELPHYLAIAEALEAATGPVEIVFGHNDLMAANILDDGTRLWLIDWDYAGFNTPLFDLGGLAANNQFTPAQEREMLELYFRRPADDALFHRYLAMKCAALLRETMWSMVSEAHSSLDVDYAAYTTENMTRFERAHATFQQS